MANNQLTQQIQQMRRRVQGLYQEGNGPVLHSGVLEAAFEELELALEQLQIAEGRQHQEHEAWLNERAALEMEMQSFQHLFEHAPAGYLVTSLDGTIRKTNPLAARILECAERNMIGRSIALFVPEGQRREFRDVIAQMAESDGIHERTVVMQSWERSAVKVGLIIQAVRSKTGDRPIALHWLLRELGQSEAAETPADGSQPTADRSTMLEQARQRLDFLARAIVEVNSIEHPEALGEKIAHLAVPGQADVCVIDLTDPQRETTQRLVVMRDRKSKDGLRSWRSTFATDMQELEVGAATPQPSAAAQPAQLDISKPEDLRAVLGSLEAGSAMVAPIQHQERQIGSIAFIRSHASREYNASDIALVEALANAIGSALGRLQEV